ncbi:hypothetical protein OIV83_001284 [Microbotryomycetes sp. JL201]|nr:hypothetical protein OIV83_001284 [Microbotryomycetes sp. JL201]
MSQQPGYTVDPPTYSQPSAKKAYGATEPAADQEPLLGAEPHASGSSQPRNAWHDEAAEGDVPDDFKVSHIISPSPLGQRKPSLGQEKQWHALFTSIVGALMMRENVASWVQQNSGLLLIPMLGALAFMGLAFWRRHSHPLNLVFLAAFTACEALTLGAVVSMFEQTIVLQALIITTAVFLGLTLFTMQSKYDFDSMGPYLFGFLLVFFFTGLVNIFVPFSRTTDAVFAGIGSLLFSAYIVYDTHLICRRLHVDDWVLGSISLYLDFINLFLQVLRLLNDIEDR